MVAGRRAGPAPTNEDFTTGVAVDPADGAIYVTSTVNGGVDVRQGRSATAPDFGP
jgi:DNA-binding beta-propeller fold protein YncE